jgi:hypothetical protein
MQKDLALDTGLMNTALAITALFSGIFIIFIGGLADPDRSRENRDGRLRAEHHWIAANRLRAAWSRCIIFPPTRSCVAGPVWRLHHAGEPGFG